MKTVHILLALLTISHSASGERIIPSQLDPKLSQTREKAFTPWSTPTYSSMYWEILASLNVPIYNERKTDDESRDIYIPNPGLGYWVLGGLSEAQLWKVEGEKLKIGDELVSASVYKDEQGNNLYWALWVPKTKAYLVKAKMQELGITPARVEASPGSTSTATSDEAFTQDPGTGIINAIRDMFAGIDHNSAGLNIQQQIMSVFQRSADAKAIAKLEAAKDDYSRWCALDAAAKGSLDQGHDIDARRYAEELEQLAPKYTKDWNYGNAVQDFNIVLGRLALKNGDIEAAKKHLLAAGHSPGSPQMDTFGPNMSLAKDLLAKGETAVVLEYFELCGTFWEMDDGKLNEWKRDVEQKQFPDFGANLLY